MSEENNKRQFNRGGLVWIEFRGHRRAVFANPYEFPFHIGDIAIVEDDRGQDAGVVKHVLSTPLQAESRLSGYTVIRRATTQDIERIESLRNKEKESIDICRERIAEHNLSMRLVDAEYRFDGLKLIFYFTAEGRVDFRDLVRNLAGTFRTRIELRQIGSRDEVKRSDGYGVCGYRLCCVNFLDTFQPITTHMAKLQNLILNPSKLSGICGKLKCCLAYEFEYYDKEMEERTIVEFKEPGIREEDLDDMSD